MGSPITSPAKPTAHTRDGSGSATGVGKNNKVARDDDEKYLSVETANVGGGGKGRRTTKGNKNCSGKTTSSCSVQSHCHCYHGC